MRLKVLIVEDEVIIALAAKIALEKQGLEVAIAGSGETALHAITSDHTFDVILMDIDLGPGVNGADAARDILACRDLPIIYFTSHTEEEVVRLTEDILSYGILNKSATGEVIKATIVNAYNLHAVHLALREKQQALAEHRARTAFAQCRANEGVWEVDLVTNEVYLNPRDCEILGYSVHEARRLIKVWSELVHEDDLPRTNKALVETLEGKEDLFHVEQRLRTKSGAWKWVFTRGVVVARDRYGKPVRMTGTHTDLSSFN